MPANGTTTKTTPRKSAPRTTQTTTTSRTDAQRIREGLNKVRNGSVSYARQTAERTVDVPVGVVLTVADRVNEIVEPFTKRETAERELKSFRTQVERELNKLERRGATARRKARTRARQTRNRVERQVKQRRRRFETTVKQNRAQVEKRPEAGADHGSGAGLDARLAPLARAASRGGGPGGICSRSTTSRAEQQPLLPDRPAIAPVDRRSRAAAVRPATMSAVALPTKEQVTEALQGVIDPELRRSIVELGMVRSVEIADDGRVEVVVSLTTPGCPIRSHFQNAVAEQVGELEGVTGVGVGFDVLSNEEKGQPPADARPAAPPRGRAGPGQERRLRRVGQGRRRQVDDDRQPGRRAAGRGPLGGRPRLRRLRLLDPPHARRQQQARGERRAQDRPAHRARRASR